MLLIMLGCVGSHSTKSAATFPLAFRGIESEDEIGFVLGQMNVLRWIVGARPFRMELGREEMFAALFDPVGCGSGHEASPASFFASSMISAPIFSGEAPLPSVTWSFGNRR